MKLNHKLIAWAVVMLLFTSCDKFLDVNENVNAPTDVNMSALLPSVIERTSQAHFYMARQGNLVTQHIANVVDYPERVTSTRAWSNIYLNALDDAKDIQSRAGSSPHYAGVAEVLDAINIGLLADHWESAVYSDGLKATDNLTPAYDSQEELYATLNRKLSDAIAHLESDESVESPGSDDLAYGGDLEKWIKLAYTLKARYAMHLSNKGIDAITILADLDKGMESNGDNFLLNYSTEHKNYWHLFALGNNTGNYVITQGDYLIESMKNIVSGGDPRLPMITDVPTTIDSLDGKSVESSDTYNTNFTATTWHSTEGAPNVMVSFAEAKFIEAEAALSSNPDRAYAAYLAGIDANMNMMGVSSGTYLSDASVAVGKDNLKLSDIMLQKYFAMYLSTEAWVDMRRHQYSSDVFPGFIAGDPHMLGGPLQRFYYPDSELDRNGTEVAKVIKDDIEKMWRD